MAKKPTLLRQNNKGQITKDFSILVTKKLQTVAEEVNIRIKPLIRDELQYKYKTNVLATYAPTSETGQAVKDYNKAHKHQKSASYHHTGKFLDSIHAVIDENTVKIIIEENIYDDGATTLQVYEWLRYGTTKNPKSDRYPYIKKQGGNYSTGWASYNPTPKHPFEEMTLEQMKGFLDTLTGEFKNKTVKKEYMKYVKHKRGRKEEI